MVTTHKLSQQTHSDYRQVKRRINAGVAANRKARSYHQNSRAIAQWGD